MYGLDNLQKLVSVGAIHRFIFSFDNVVIILVNSIIVFRKQPSAERYLANILSSVFLGTFRKFL